MFNMGLLDFLKKKRKAKPPENDESELKKALSEKYEQEDGERKTLMLGNMSIEEPKVYSPTVEHPLLTIQDRLARIEETYRALNERIIIIDGKVATKQDIDDLKAMVHEDLSQGDRILGEITDLGGRLTGLRKTKEELTRQVDESTRKVTRNVEVIKKIDEEIELLECDQKIVDSLKERDKSTIELAKDIGLTRQYIWGRLKELQQGGYVKSVKKGRQTRYQLLKNA